MPPGVWRRLNGTVAAAANPPLLGGQLAECLTLGLGALAVCVPFLAATTLLLLGLCPKLTGSFDRLLALHGRHLTLALTLAAWLASWLRCPAGSTTSMPRA